MSSNTEVINFHSGKKEYRSLCNFYENHIFLDGIKFDSGEHAFHFMKYKLLSEDCEDYLRSNILREYSDIFSSPSILVKENDIKKAGGKKGLKLSDDEIMKWDEISTDIQEDICRYKLLNDLNVREDLKKSDNKILVYYALRCSTPNVQSKFWKGKCIIINEEIIIIGGNKLGKIWMKIRDEIN